MSDTQTLFDSTGPDVPQRECLGMGLEGTAPEQTLMEEHGAVHHLEYTCIFKYECCYICKVHSRKKNMNIKLRTLVPCSIY